MALGEVKLSQTLPTTKTPPISAKREFEKLILEICRIAANSRATAGEYMEALIKKSEENTQAQTSDHKLGSYAEIIGGIGTSIVTFAVMYKNAEVGKKLENVSPAFQIGSKVGEMGKNYFSTSQYSHQMEKEKIQHANTQWQTWASGLQEVIRNLEAGKQRLQQMEDATNR